MYTLVEKFNKRESVMKTTPFRRLKISRNAALVVVVLLAFAAYIPTLFVKADADPALVGGTAVSGYSGTATPITDLQLSGTGNPTVPVKLRVSSGSLTMSTTTGLTFTGSSSGSTLQFSGTLANINAALSTLTYTRTGTGTDTLEASLVNAGEVFFPDNNHLYEYVSYTASWVNANTNAQTRTKYGATGYLTTITSQAENDFVAARLLNAGWMGASDSASEGDWKWVTGPESGTSFWSGASGGSSVGGRYANWGTGEPNNAGDEDCAQFLTGGTGKWNDLPCSSTTLPGYVVEYGSPSSPIEISSKNVSITTGAANQYPVVSTLGPTGYVNGSWTNDTTPTLTFSATDPDAGNTVAYQVIIDNNSNFSSPEVSYTSAQVSQGSKSFTVGQAAGSGTYTVGSADQTLSDGQYYWRVRATDNIGAVGSYTTANSGSIAFGVDTSAPSQPPTPTTSSAGNDNTPTFSWDPITSSGSTSGTVTIEWSQDPDFGSGVSSGSVSWPTSTSYTVTTPLSDGTWYFRTRATDSAGNNSPYSSSTSATIDTTAPTVPGKPSVGASATRDATPTWEWAASTDTSAGLHTAEPYTVEWSDDEDFNSVTATSIATTNSFTIPNADELSEGEWYFRVKAKDNLGNTSAYSQVGQVLVDTTPPSIPGKPAVISAKNNTPAWSWAMSTDDGSGMDTVPYIIEWSQSPNFTGTVYSNSSKDASYQHATKLSSGTWYSRVKAQDTVGNMSDYSQLGTVFFAAPLVIKSVTSIPNPISNNFAYETPETEQDLTIPAPIVLNVFKEYSQGKGKGKLLNLSQFQVIYFKHNGEEHTITVKQIADDYVIVTVASTPTDVKIVRGTTVAHDVDGDGKNDISISFAAITGDKAQMSFKELSAKTVAPIENSRFTIWPYVLAAASVITIGYILIRRIQQAH